MRNSGIVRLTGGALILGVLAFAFGLVVQSLAPAVRLRVSGLEEAGWVSIFVSVFLIGIGLLGARARYGERAGTAGSALLLVGAIGGFAASTGGIEALYRLITPDWWVIAWVGMFVMFACTMGFGVVAMRRRPLPRLNWLPILSGAFSIALLIGAATGGDFASLDALFAAAALVSALVLLPLGYMLQAGMRREPAAA
ncbi:MAG: hypothetical protein P8189_16765 [Anaerolineae bacterium]|jgi:hypothetical protein